MVADGGPPPGAGDDSSDSSTADGPVSDADGPANGDAAASDAAASDAAASDAAEDAEEAEPTDEEVVAAASHAAEDVVFSRYRRSDVRDVDVAVGFEDGLLSVDVYLNVPDADAGEHVDEEAEQVADDAALAAIAAVDRLFEERGE